MHNRDRLETNPQVSRAVANAIAEQEASGHSPAEIFSEPLVEQVAERALGQLALRPESNKNRRMAQRFVAIELSNRSLEE